MAFMLILQVFGVTGNFLRRFGSKGSEFGQFDTPACLAIDQLGNVLVCDTGNGRVQVLTPQGAFITEFKSASKAQLLCVHVDRDGRILVGRENGRVDVFAFDA